MNKIEILAPAGSLLSAIVAFENGADAVYIGLKKLNARERAKNFTFDEYKKLLEYSKRKNKKVYLTLNTLIKESELPLLIDIINELSIYPPNAVIIQDFAVYYIVKNYFPNLKIHASTQMGIHNSAGVNLLDKMGFERVILERQTTLDEIKNIRKKTSVELEIFVHGSLCCSLSGMCLFSSWMGGHSGNRGMCKQPCRRKYAINSDKEFIFSANDLSLIDKIDQIKQIGVQSLKIEGRQKNENYIKNIVKAFRLVIDDSSKENINKAKNILSYSFGRKWSEGFSTTESLKTVVSSQKSGASGMFIGKVNKITNSGFLFTPKRGFNKKYILRIQPKNGEGGKIIQNYSIFINNKFTNNVSSKKEIELKTNEVVNIGDAIYIAGMNDDFSKEINIVKNLKPINPTLNIEIEIAKDNITFIINKIKRFIYKIDTQKPKTISINSKIIRKIFNTLPNYNTNITNIIINEELFILEKELKRVKKLLEKENLLPEKLDIPLTTHSQMNTTNQITINGSPKNHKISSINTINTQKIGDNIKKNREILLDELVPEDNLNKIINNIEQLYKNGIRKFRVTSLFYFQLLNKYNDIEISTSFPIHISNQWAAKIYTDLGANKLQLAVELDKNELNLLLKEPFNWELYAYGIFPILQTRAKLSTTGVIHDLRGAKFNIIKNNNIYKLYPTIPFKNLDINNIHREINLYYDYSQTTNKENKTNSFNLEREFN